MSNLVALKMSMLVEQGYPAVTPMCPCRQLPATELHHIIPRSWTQTNPEARRRSEVRELMILLCPACHAQAHNPYWRIRYLDLNAARYGKPQVAAALSSVAEVCQHNVLNALHERIE